MKKFNLSQMNIFSKGKSKLEPRIYSLLQQILPHGKKVGSEYISTNPTRYDQKLGSFKINIHTGKWADFATNDKGGDIISLYAYIKGISQKQSLLELLKLIGEKL